MFYAMAEEKIDLRGYRFEHRLEGIQTLTSGRCAHISAVSIHPYAYITDKYALLPCGARLGDGHGPMIVSVETEELAAGAVTRRSGNGCAGEPSPCRGR